MKRSVALFLILSLALGILVGCKKKYKPVESTEDEARVVMTLSLGDNVYEVRYELYRAFFLTYRSEIDGGDGSVWSGDEREKYIEKINARIAREVCSIYAVFELCGRIGFDLYSKEVDKKIEEMIRISVEGGVYGDEIYTGFDGDYDKYLSSLKELYHNYQTSVLMLRYRIGREMLEEHYVGEALPAEKDGMLTDGALKYDRESVESFYLSEDAVRVYMTYIPEEISYTPRDMAEKIRTDVVEAAKSGDEAVRILMINRGTPTAAAELESGVLFGRYSLARDYSVLADAALELSDGEVSRVIETVSATDGRRFYVVYRAEKTDEFFEQSYASVVEVYLYDAIGEILSTTADSLAGGLVYTDAYSEIIHSEVAM